ncbi:UPF0082 protein MCRO_0552 [Mycoplasmopsis californica]|uniref:Probable transcriptional regulatory protein NPA09_00910 n=1 Tax=Mycoplasmopsis equigenitalium TaxID=114883 RepID=A0ABY5J3L9_9BACT|nr:YebC/PmpR family DNA-binding transcriptional regulator [Mycoplasmopsis equigenitalium]UUD37121.1 YebC/PmpR family DNA-binding transcriptional regulator [Mycoplasmopsis equigenitalium]VEU69573.1 UPF0082 protein MCRO_0552 [Mycoplasmopsis californica]
MAGHSKWANIQHRKGAQDAKRGVAFQKLSKEIYVAAAHGGTDPNMNPALRLAISKAKSQSMPKANIEKAIQKAAGGNNDGANFVEYLYSGVVSGGVTILISCLSDNFNRLSSNMKAYFNKQNGTIGKVGTMPYVFDQKGLIQISDKLVNEDALTEFAIENGAEEIENEEGIISITCAPSDFQKLSESIEKEFKIEKFEHSAVTYVPNSYVELDEERTQKILASIEKLEDDEDVQEVFHNIDL